MPPSRDAGPIRTAYFIRVPNVGDRANPSIVSALAGWPVAYATDRSLPHLLAAGSLIATATAQSQIWGVGMIDPGAGIGGAAAGNIHALRGQLTYERVTAAGVALGDTPLGDPGFLAPSLLGVRKAIHPTFPIGLVRHYVDREDPALRRMLKEPGVADLNVHDDPATFLARMSECETVISTSLHGLIFAEALGIPNLWLKASDRLVGGEFKFRDWYTTVRRPQREPRRLRDGDTAAALALEAETRESLIDVAALAAAFPHALLDQLRAPDTELIPTLRCRTRPVPVFLASLNRGAAVKATVAALSRLRRDTCVVVYDAGSDDAETLAALDALADAGLDVLRAARAATSPFDGLGDAIAQFFSAWAEPQRYVVSDCTADLTAADPRTLDVYDELLNMVRSAECVGAPVAGDLADARTVETSAGAIGVCDTVVASAFTLHRAGARFEPTKPGLSVRQPFGEALAPPSPLD